MLWTNPKFAEVQVSWSPGVVTDWLLAVGCFNVKFIRQPSEKQTLGRSFWRWNPCFGDGMFYVNTKSVFQNLIKPHFYSDFESKQAFVTTWCCDCIILKGVTEGIGLLASIEWVPVISSPWLLRYCWWTNILHHLACIKPRKIMGFSANLNWLARFLNYQQYWGCLKQRPSTCVFAKRFSHNLFPKLGCLPG